MWRALLCRGREVLPNATAVHDRTVLRSVGRLQRGVVAGAGSAVDGFTNCESAAVLVAPAIGSLAQRSPRGPLDLVGPGIPRRVLYANQPRRVGLRRALPPAGRVVFLAGGRARTTVVRSLAQRVGASGVGPDRVLAAVPRYQCRATFQRHANPSVRRPMPDNDLHGRRADARHPTIVSSVGHSGDLVCHRRVGGVPFGRTRRLRPPNRRYCTGDLLDAEEQPLLGIAKCAESASARDTDISK